MFGRTGKLPRGWVFIVTPIIGEDRRTSNGRAGWTIIKSMCISSIWITQVCALANFSRLRKIGLVERVRCFANPGKHLGGYQVKPRGKAHPHKRVCCINKCHPPMRRHIEESTSVDERSSRRNFWIGNLVPINARPPWAIAPSSQNLCEASWLAAFDHKKTKTTEAKWPTAYQKWIRTRNYKCSKNIQL
jgi:hypothetical protein